MYVYIAQKLKQFLHPECKLCDALFHTRLEMDEHKLTAGHLKVKLAYKYHSILINNILFSWPIINIYFRK